MGLQAAEGAEAKDEEIGQTPSHGVHRVYVVQNAHFSLGRGGWGWRLFLAVDKLVGRPLQGTARFRAPKDDFFNFSCQGKIFIRDAAGRMGFQFYPELSPGDGQVSVVIGGLAQVPDGIGEHERGRPTVGVILPPQPAVLEIPFREVALFDLGLNFLIGVNFFLRSRHTWSSRLGAHGLEISTISKRSFPMGTWISTVSPCFLPINPWPIGLVVRILLLL